MGIFFFLLYSLSKIDGASVKSTEALPKAEPEKHEEGSYIGAPFMFLYIVTVFYFALNYYYNLIVENKKLLAFLQITGIMLLAAYTYQLILYYFIPSALSREYESPGHILSSLLSYMIPVLIICFLFAYVSNMREAVKQRRILQAQKLQLEAQISQANFNFLKAQINPHFLHNTLNFLYAKSLPYSAELSEGILTLSDIMRYALNQGNQKDGKAPLKDEIEHVQNVIKISQLRFSNQLKVNFEIEGNVEGRMIIPFVLITLVENAFKHGDLKNPDYPIDIKVNNINIDGECLILKWLDIKYKHKGSKRKMNDAK